MILISVKSVFMDIKHQEPTDVGAEKWLKKTQKLHQTYLAHHVSKKPKAPHGNSKGYSKEFAAYQQKIKEWNELMAECKMRVEIINTDANQLNLAI